LSVLCEHIIEAGWLAALIITPLFFNVYSSRVFEPDKLSLLRSLALMMTVAWMIKTLETATQSEPESAAPEQRGPRRRSRREDSPSEQDQPETEAAPVWSRLWLRLRRVPLVFPTLLLVSSYLISTLFSITPRVSLWGSYQRLQGTYTTLSYIVIFFLALQHLRRREQLERLVTVVIVTSIPISIYGIVQHYKLDPLPWGGDVVSRVSSNMGNPIFIAAYLVMAVFLTTQRAIASFRALLREEAHGLANAVLGGTYIFVVAIQLLCMVFSQSRGPLLGLIGGIFFMALLFALVHRLRWLAVTMVITAFLLGTFFVVFNLPQSPLAPLREAPYIGRLGTILDLTTGTNLVRALIWEGVVKLIWWHEPLRYPDGTPDGFNFLRPIIGYGPEAMYVAYNPFYPPDLAHIEARNASPDRSHNETFDALVITGFLGFAAYIFLFGSIFFYGLKWLGLMNTAKDRNRFIALGTAGAFLGIVIPWVLEGTPKLVATGLPFGFIIGLTSYLALAALFPPAEQAKQDADREIQWLIIALVAAIAAHFIEIHFGIAIASTRTYFWTYSAVLAVLGLRLLQMKPQPAGAPVTPPSVDRPGRTRSRRRRERSVQGPTATELTGIQGPVREVATFIALACLIFITLSFDYITNQLQHTDVWRILADSVAVKIVNGQPVPSYGILWLLILTWLAGGLIGLAEIARRQEPPIGIGWWIGAAVSYTGVVVLVFLVFSLIHATALQPPRSDVTQTIVRYYVAAFLMVGIVALTLWRREELKSADRGLRVAYSWLYLILVIALGWAIWATNLSIIVADIYYKQGQAYENMGQLDASIDRYRHAVELNRNEDFYYLFLGRAYLEKAKTTQNPAEQLVYLEESRKVLEKARDLNPLNTDHTANLARLHRTWAEMETDPARRAALFQKSLDYYTQATALSPHNAQLFNEWGLVYYLMGQPDKAMEKLQQSLALDQLYDQTYLYMADVYMSMGDLAKAEEAYKKALEINPSLFQAHSALGYIYSQQGRLEEAVAENLAVLEVAPTDYASHKNLSLLYQRLGRIDEALAQVEEALQYAPEQERGPLYTFQGDLFRALGRVDEAIAAYSQAVKLAPNLIQARSALALLLAHQGRLDEALAQNLEILKISPQDYATLKNIAILYQQKGDLTQALNYAHAALSIAPASERAALEAFVAQLEQSSQ